MPPLPLLAIVFAAGIAGRPASAQAPLTSGGPVPPALLEDLAVAYKILAMEGIIDAYGHVSVRHPDQSEPLPDVTVARARAGHTGRHHGIRPRLDTVDPKGRNAVLERFIHGEIYKARPDVMVVVHSHAPSVVPFSITQVPLRPVFHMSTFLWKGVPVWDSRSVKDPDAAALLVRNGVMGRSLAATLGDKSVALLRGHGNVVVGPNLPVTVRQTIYTEVNAKLLLAALALGGPVTYISPEEGAAVDKNPGDVMRGWELWKRKALGE